MQNSFPSVQILFLAFPEKRRRIFRSLARRCRSIALPSFMLSLFPIIIKPRESLLLRSLIKFPMKSEKAEIESWLRLAIWFVMPLWLKIMAENSKSWLKKTRTEKQRAGLRTIFRFSCLEAMKGGVWLRWL